MSEDLNVLKAEANRAVSDCEDYLETACDLVIGSDDPDVEHRKVVARQLASLIHEDSMRRLRSIASRSDDQELQKIVSESKKEVFRATRYVLKRFVEARPIQSNELRQARIEANQ